MEGLLLCKKEKLNVALCIFYRTWNMNREGVASSLQ